MEEQTCNACPTPKVTRQRVALSLFAVIGVYFLMTTFALNLSPDTGSAQGLGAVFAIGLVAALSSCTAVVTGVVAAVSATRVHWSTHVIFNLGRLLGFAGFGALIGFLGQVLKLSPFANGIMVIALALLMITLGAHLMGILPKGVWFFRPPEAVSRHILALTTKNHASVPLVLGALSFFLPCGFTQSVQLMALSTGSPAQAALIMTVFALGTLPTLLGVGLATSFVSGGAMKKLTYAIGVLVMALGVASVQNGATLLGFSGFHNEERISAPLSVIVEGKQFVQMEASIQGYAPSVVHVVEGTPVRWQIYGNDQLGCASTFVVPDFGVSERLTPGYNEIEFTPDRPGKHVFSCSMGMVRGTLVVHPKT